MFFFLSKVLFALVAPVSIILILLILFFATGIRKYAWWAFGLLLFFTNPLITQWVIQHYEIPAVNKKQEGEYEAIIIASGFTGSMFIDGQLRYSFSSGSDRMLQAVDLYKRGISSHILFTGGTDTLFGSGIPEARSGRAFLLTCGIPDSSIWVEDASVNTFENASNSARLMELEVPGWRQKKFLLVTSAFHMRRALACFEKQGFRVDPYSTDLKSIRNRNSLLNTILPDINSMETWTLLVKEWIGLVVYKMKGYI